MNELNGSPYFLTSARLGFRRWAPGDLEIAVGLWGDPEVTKLLDSRGRLSRQQVRDRLAREIATQRTHEVQYWPIFLLTTGEHVGCCGLRPARGMLEIGFHVRYCHWRRGYASEAAARVIAHAFESLGAKALFAGHHPENGASRDLLRKLGFRHTHDESYEPTGLEHPSYRLTAEEYARGGRP